MLYTAYKNGMLYNSQREITLPRASDGEKIGHGIMTFLMAKNQNKAIEVINDDVMYIKESLTRRYFTDTIYKYKFGVNIINSIERSDTDRKFNRLDKFELDYVPSANISSVLDKKYNIMNDLSRWMDLFFSNTISLSVPKRCQEFAILLPRLLNSPLYSNYKTKLLIFDVDSWVASAKSCVIMNPRLLNNPLSILLYTAVKYPDLLLNLPDIRVMILSRKNRQVIFYNLKDINKRNYPSIKSKLSQFRTIVFSTDDDIDPNSNSVDQEVDAIITNSIKKEIFNKINYSLLGSTDTDSDEDIDDITVDLTDEFDDDDPDITESLYGVNDKIEEILDDALAETEGDINVDEIVKNVTDKLTKNTFVTKFIADRTPEQQATIERLTKGQENVLLQRNIIKEADDKSISETELGSLIGITNPNYQTSKFVNFDGDYTKKMLQRNIDDAVGILASADAKIFVTAKEVVDSSSPMDLKETYTYSLVDEKNNKMTLKFDIPKIVDDNYIYINGSKKNINHQFILKPIVKTAPDTVQLVTAYNKIFIWRRGKVNQNMSKIITYLLKNTKEYDVSTGICHALNSDYILPVDYIMLSRQLTRFKIGTKVFNLQISKNIDEYKALTGKVLKYNELKEFPIGIDMGTKKPILMKLTDSYSEFIYDSFTDDNKATIGKIKRKPKLIMAKAKIMRKEFPLILFMLYCEGFASVMKKANIEHHFIQKADLKKYDSMQYDFIAFEDGFIAWKKMPFRNELLMNGLKASDFTSFSLEELESKDTYVSLLLDYFPGVNKINVALDNYKDFTLDAKTKEILIDLGYPTDLVSLLVFAAEMLCTTDYLIENNQNNMRVRSNEVIADLVYIAVTSAYTKYRNTAYKAKPTKLSIKQSAVIDKLLSSDTNMIEEFSTMNPILELEKRRAISFKGLRGIQKDRAMTLPRRSFDASMLGTVAITTSPDANVGVVRQLTMEPQITSTYGYINTTKSGDYDNLHANNLFSVGELINPFGINHDDPDRSAMSYKQTKYMVPIKDSDHVLVGNKVERLVPYLLSDEFIVDAKEDGTVVAKNKDYCIIKYSSGKKMAIDISTRLRKNSSQGTWTDNTLHCELQIGDTFTKGDILAYNDKQFSKNRDDRGASLNLGALAKIAISSQWDVFEDSTPISKRLSEKLVTDVVDEKHITLSRHTMIDYMVKVGDKVNAGDLLLRFSDAADADIAALLATMSQEKQEEVLNSAKTTINSKYTGEVVDIRMYTTVPTEELSDTLRPIVEKYHKRIKARNKILKDHQNEDDMDYYKAGQIINEIDEVVKVGNNGKLRGHIMNPEDDIMILIYIKYELSASKGDKVVVSVCKGIISHVFEEGMEPYSEYNPNEPIDTIVAPLAVAARKVPAIFLTIFSNKLIIELKNQLREIYES